MQTSLKKWVCSSNLRRYLSLSTLYWGSLSLVVHRRTNLNCVFIVRIGLCDAPGLEGCTHTRTSAMQEGNDGNSVKQGILRRNCVCLSVCLQDSGESVTPAGCQGAIAAKYVNYQFGNTSRREVKNNKIDVYRGGKEMVVQFFLTRNGRFSTFSFVNIFYLFNRRWIKFSPCWHSLFFICCAL